MYSKRFFEKFYLMQDLRIVTQEWVRYTRFRVWSINSENRFYQFKCYGGE